MATAAEIASKALKRILVEADEAPLETTEYDDFYEVMNDYMASLEAVNINLGYTPVSTGTDTVTVPAGAIRGMVANLAIEASPDYGGHVSNALIKQASDGMIVLRKLGRMKVKLSMDSNLPRGSGNYDSTFDQSLYGSTEKALVSLSGNTTATSISATNTKVRVAGYWRSECSRGLFADIDGVITNVSGKTLSVTVGVNLTLTGNSTYTVSLMRNDYTADATVSGAITSSPSDLTITQSVTFKPGDTLSLWIEDDLATEDVTVVDAQFEVT